jgi:hypothetical protein
MNKKVILTIESVYTANAFQVGSEFYVGAGSETKPEVYLYNIKNDSSSFVDGCPGGVMSFIPTPGNPDCFFSIMGLFPPFIGAEAGVFMHQELAEKWTTTKVLELPFAHRCELINREGVNYLFAASVSKHKKDPADWSKKGEVYLARLNENFELPLKWEMIDDSIIRNHGMIRAQVDGVETVCISGAEGIYYFEQHDGDKWEKKLLFDKEVSEFAFVDLDGDGQNELVTVEPFHGQTLSVYKKIDGKWELKFSDTLSFGHGLSAGMFKGEPIIVVGSRRGSYALDMFKVDDLSGDWKLKRELIEGDTGPTQTQVFTANGTDYILSSNQVKNEVVLYS